MLRQANSRCKRDQFKDAPFLEIKKKGQKLALEKEHVL